MRRAGILHFFAFVFMLLFLAACGFFEIFNTGGTDPGTNSRCNNVLKKHAKSIAWHLSLTCKYQEKCEANVAYIGVLELGLDSIQCYDHSEYKFDDGKTKKTVKMNTTVPVTVDDDDHVRFSLFDSEKVEKTYDIDLSEIIHSYTVKDDSVEIKMPEGLLNAYMECPYCVSMNHSAEICEDHYMCHYHYNSDKPVVSVGTDSTWGKYIYMEVALAKQSSMKADSVSVSAKVYFRE